MNLTIGWLYPDLMGIYGDRGNIIVLENRCLWRGIEAKIKIITLENKPDELKECDLLFMGGAQDCQQEIVFKDLQQSKGAILKEMIEMGIPTLLVCAAYQLAGKMYTTPDGVKVKYLGLLDFETIHFGKNKPRCIGNIIIKPEYLKSSSSTSLRIQEKFLVGFENHGGRTYLGKNVKPFGEVIIGHGNNSEDKTEGCIYKNTFCTYLHGPVLPKNSEFADLLIKLSLEKKYQKEVELEDLDDSLELKAKEFIIRKYGQ